MEKLKLTIQRWPTCREVQIHIRYADEGALEEQVKALKEKYSFLPARYIELLSKYDGIDVACFVFFSLSSKRFPIHEEIRDRCREYEFDVDTACPFAEDASGNPLFMHGDGSVWLYETDPPIARRRVCSSFDELMGDGFFGEKYMTMVNVLDPIPEGENLWLKYLRESGWHQ
jgi:hypothetical protein